MTFRRSFTFYNPFHEQSSIKPRASQSPLAEF
jgi:hypothetical protein